MAVAAPIVVLALLLALSSLQLLAPPATVPALQRCRGFCFGCDQGVALSPTFSVGVPKGSQRRPSAPVAAPVRMRRRGVVAIALAIGVGTAVVLFAWAIGVLRRVRSIRHAESRRKLVTKSEVKAMPQQTAVPADYRAAGVLFFTRDAATGLVARVLLGVEERNVRLKELRRGSGSARLRVLIFPQGKRERCDEDFIATARREFVEETGDSTNLAAFLEAQRVLDPPPCWFSSAKMAVVFCEVPADLAESSTLATKPCAGQKPLLPVWVDAHDIRSALASQSTHIDVGTEVGSFPLFPLTRRFLFTEAATHWLNAALPVDMTVGGGASSSCVK